MSITAIARQAQGIRAGESSPSSLKTPTSCESTIESTNLLPPGPATTKPQVATPTTVPTVLGLSSPLSPTALEATPAGPHRVATATTKSSLTALRPAAAPMTLTAAAATVEAPTTGPTGGPVAAAVAAAEATRTATPPASPPSHPDFATCSSPTSSSLWGSPSTT
jgi:hypothetical protein